MRQQINLWKRQNRRIGFVPTMGALHRGHYALVEHANKMCDHVCVSIFVNPKQFAPTEDFDRYPRPEARDLELLAEWPCSLIYRPSVESLYPPEFDTQIHVPSLSNRLCGSSRPHFFSAVALIVTKLLCQVSPDVVVFGEKDYQQLQIVKRLVADLDLPVQVESVATVRESDGLACSSRNNYLTPEQRSIAPHLYRILRQTANALYHNNAIDTLIDDAIDALYSAGFDSVDYLRLCDSQTLQTLSQVTSPARLAAAVYLGETRLIDNIPLPQKSDIL